MSLLVQKFGGTSVGSLERIARVATRVMRARAQGDAVVVVVSAMSGETDRLLGLARSIQERPTPRELDVLLSTGEQVTIALLAMTLQENGCAARSYTGHQVRIRTDGAHTRARIVHIDDERIRADLAAGRVVVVAGFQGEDEDGNITTLGRGGSDTTAVALAAALGADECRIYTDVDGVYTTDPRVVPEARRLEVLTFEEMLELASLGAKVLQNIEVDMIVQNVGADGSTDLTFTVKRGDYDRVCEMLGEISGELGARGFEGDNRIVKISVVGVGMRSHAGVATRMFDALAAENINIRMISTSEIKISVVVDERYLELAVRAVHDAFELSAPAVEDE